MHLLSWQSSILVLCALIGLGPGLAVHAEEGGAGHYVPGGFATLIDLPSTKPGWAINPLYLHYDGDLTALRYQDWKLIFMEQRVEATFQAWIEPFVPLRLPYIEHLRRDPYERALITSNTYYDWLLDRAYLLVPAQAYVGQFLATFKEYPPRQKAASFSLEKVLEKLQSGGGSH